MHSTRCCLFRLAKVRKEIQKKWLAASNHMQLQQIQDRTTPLPTDIHRLSCTKRIQKTQSLLISFVDDLRQTAPRWSPCRDVQRRFARQLIVKEAGHMLQLNITWKHQRTGYPPDSAGLSLSCQLGQKHLWHVWPSLPECVVLRHGQPVRRDKQTIISKSDSTRKYSSLCKEVEEN